MSADLAVVGGRRECARRRSADSDRGEKRLSDFLLWECTYAELAFLDAMWPDFTPANLAGVIADFRRRERRFGALTPPLAMATA